MSTFTVPEASLAEAREVRALMLRAIEEKGGDYVYSVPTHWLMRSTEYDSWEPIGDVGGDCVYAVKPGNDEPACPSCLIGYVASYHGGVEELEELSWAEGNSPDDSRVLPWVKSSVVRAAAKAAQSKQDRKGTWAEALAEFDAEIGVHWGPEGLALVVAA